MEHEEGERLIAELIDDPRTFDENGHAYALLQAYFAGLSLETLRPLLRSEDVFVQRSAAFVASELGSLSRSLLDDVIPLLCSTDRHIPYYAMETVAVCADGEHAEEFGNVARMLESDSAVLRTLAMRLMSRADASQLEAVARFFKKAPPREQAHSGGLVTLVAGDQIGSEELARMIHSADPLARRYGAIAAKRLHARFPSLIDEVASLKDEDLRMFCRP